MSTKKIRPLADRVLIREDTEHAEKKTSSGIIIPVTVNDDKGSKRGTIVAVGPGRTEDGKIVKPSVAIGDVVLFQWGDKIKIGDSSNRAGHDDEYYLVRESEILAIIK